MANSQHLEWLRSGASSWNSRRKELRFSPDLREANLSGRDLEGVNLRAADLQGASLEEANLIAADLRDAKLTDCKLREVKLEGARLSGAILRNCDLPDANLEWAMLWRADLKGSRLNFANLKNADVRQLDVRSFDFRGGQVALAAPDTAEVPEYTTDLSRAALTQVQLDSMLGDRWTKIPDDLERPAHWLEVSAADRMESVEPNQSGTQKAPEQARPPASAVAAVRQLTEQEIAVGLRQRYGDARQLAAYLIEQVEQELAAHQALATPNSEPGRSDHIDKLNALNEQRIVLEEVAKALPETEVNEVSEAQARQLREKLIALAVQVDKAIQYLDAHGGTYGGLWRLGVISGCAGLLATFSVPFEIGAGIVGGVFAGKTVTKLAQKKLESTKDKSQPDEPET